MKNKGFCISAAVITVCLAVVLINSGRRQFSGTYRAVNPPSEAGELVIECVRFKGEQLVMQSGNTQQSSEYLIRGAQLILLTDFGDFTFPFEETERGFKIDDIEYVKD